MLKYLSIFLIALSNFGATTVVLTNGTSETVNAVYQTLFAGDHLVIPGGDWIWTNQVLANRGVFIRGTNSPLIRDAYTNPSGSAVNASNVLLSVQGTNIFWCDGLNFITHTNKTSVGNQAAFARTETEVPFAAFSRLTFTNYLAAANWYLLGPSLVYLCRTSMTNQVGAANGGIAVDWRLRNNSYGDDSWATPLANILGTTNQVVLEDSEWWSTNVTRGISDGFGGACFTIRYVTSHGHRVDNHGTESTTLARGTRCMELYGITMTGGNSTGFHWRSGSGVIWGNNVSGPNTFSHMASYRNTDYFPNSGLYFGGADGTGIGGSAWDANDVNGPLGGSLYAQGTHNTTNGSIILQNTNATWTANQWQGYQLLNTNKHRISEILSNTTTMIYVSPSTQGDVEGYAIVNSPTNDLVISAVDTSLETLTVTSHGYSTPQVASVQGNPPPGGTSFPTKYFIRAIDANTLALYIAQSDANNDINRVNITSLGTSPTIARWDVSAHNTMIWDVGDPYEIRKVNWVIDHPGSGASINWNGDRDGNPAPAWLQQTNEPIYLWNNTFNGDTNLAVMTTSQPSLQNGREWTNNVARPGYIPLAYPHPARAFLDASITYLTPLPQTGLKKKR